MRILYDEDLKKYSTFRIGGKAKKMFFPENRNELKELIILNPKSKYIGKGSNILINDKKTFSSVVSLKMLNSVLENLGNGLFKCGCSVTVQNLLNFIHNVGYGGIENLFNVPTLIGGAVAMNAGSGEEKGVYIGNFVMSVSCIDTISGNEITLNKDQCEFDYRSSVFKNNNLLIYEVIFKFVEMTPEQIQIETDWKKSKMEYQDTKYPSLGSIFDNPTPKILNLSRKIFRNKYKDGVNFSEINNNWFVNKGNGTYSQAYRIILFVLILHRLLLRKKFKIEITIWK